MGEIAALKDLILNIQKQQAEPAEELPTDVRDLQKIIRRHENTLDGIANFHQNSRAELIREHDSILKKSLAQADNMHNLLRGKLLSAGDRALLQASHVREMESVQQNNQELKQRLKAGGTADDPIYMQNLVEIKGIVREAIGANDRSGTQLAQLKSEISKMREENVALKGENQNAKDKVDGLIDLAKSIGEGSPS